MWCVRVCVCVCVCVWCVEVTYSPLVLNQVLPARSDVREGVSHARLARRVAVARVVVAQNVHPQVFAQVAIHAVHDSQVDGVPVRVQDGLGPVPFPLCAADVDSDDGFPSPASWPPLRVKLQYFGPPGTAPDEGSLERERAALVPPQRVRGRRGREERQQRRRPVHYLRPDAHASPNLMVFWPHALELDAATLSPSVHSHNPPTGFPCPARSLQCTPRRTPRDAPTRRTAKSDNAALRPHRPLLPLDKGTLRPAPAPVSLPFALAPNQFSDPSRTSNSDPSFGKNPIDVASNRRHWVTATEPRRSSRGAQLSERGKGETDERKHWPPCRTHV